MGWEDGFWNGEIYFVGVIDILMLYSTRKKLERSYKTLRFEGEVSTSNPTYYGKRFEKFIRSIVV